MQAFLSQKDSDLIYQNSFNSYLLKSFRLYFQTIQSFFQNVFANDRELFLTLFPNYPNCISRLFRFLPACLSILYIVFLDCTSRLSRSLPDYIWTYPVKLCPDCISRLCKTLPDYISRLHKLYFQTMQNSFRQYFQTEQFFPDCIFRLSRTLSVCIFRLFKMYFQIIQTIHTIQNSFGQYLNLWSFV